MLYDLYRLGHDRELYYTSSGNAKTLHMTLTVLVFQFTKLHSFRVFLMSEAHSEDTPCWTKPHGTLRVLGTSVPSAVQQNSNNFQDEIQITHSGQLVAEFLQKNYICHSVNIIQLILQSKNIVSYFLKKYLSLCNTPISELHTYIYIYIYIYMPAMLLSAQETACMPHQNY
jgi:hypothetical protein